MSITTKVRIFNTSTKSVQFHSAKTWGTTVTTSSHQHLAATDPQASAAKNCDNKEEIFQQRWRRRDLTIPQVEPTKEKTARPTTKHLAQRLMKMLQGWAIPGNSWRGWLRTLENHCRQPMPCCEWNFFNVTCNVCLAGYIRADKHISYCVFGIGKTLKKAPPSKLSIHHAHHKSKAGQACRT